MNTKPLFVALALVLALPGAAHADRKIKYYSDRDRDGHYVKRTIKVPDRHVHYYRPSSSYRSHYNYGYRSHGYYPPVSVWRPSYFYRSGPVISATISSGSRYYGPSYNSSLEYDVQRALAREGYYRGYVDGDVGPGTRAAIRAYQYDHRLAPTGRIDTALVRSLGL